MITPERARSLERWLRQLALLVALVGAGLVLRAFTSAGEELARGNDARGSGDLEAAIDHYRRVAAWGFPGNHRADEALEALATIGREAEARGDTTIALSALRSIHGAIASSPYPSAARASMREAADDDLARIASEGAPPAIDSSRSPGERRAAYRALLDAERRPSPGWALVALLGFGLWVFGGVRLFGGGFDERGEPVGPVIRRMGTLIILGLGLFALGLVLA